MCASTGVSSTVAASTGADMSFPAGLRNIHCVIHIFPCIKPISKAFALFCRKFENVVIHALLVLTFWAKAAASATVFAFCNYGLS